MVATSGARVAAPVGDKKKNVNGKETAAIGKRWSTPNLDEAAILVGRRFAVVEDSVRRARRIHT